MDTGSDPLRDFFSEETRRPDWVTASLCMHAFTILERVASDGVAFKLRLTFLEPTNGRGAGSNSTPLTWLWYCNAQLIGGESVAPRRRGSYGANIQCRTQSRQPFCFVQGNAGMPLCAVARVSRARAMVNMCGRQ